MLNMECRLCLFNEPASTSISINSNSIIKDIKDTCQLWIKDYKGWPNTICEDCDMKIKMFCKFKKSCIQSDNRSRVKLIKDNNIKSEEIILDDLDWENESSRVGPPSRSNLRINPEHLKDMHGLKDENPTLYDLLISNNVKRNVIQKNVPHNQKVLKHKKANSSNKPTLIAHKFNNIHPKQLIFEISRRRCLWDSTVDDFKNPKIKQSSWLEVAAKLVKNFINLSEVAKKKIVINIQRQWKYAQDSNPEKKLSMIDAEPKLPKKQLDKLKASKTSIENSKKLDPNEAKRQKLKDDEEFKNQMNNSDIEFFQSTLSILREFNDKEKLLFRSKLVDEIIKIKHKAYLKECK